MKKYSVETWDTELQRFTPQVGLVNPSVGISATGVKNVLMELSNMGYGCWPPRTDPHTVDPFTDDPSVSVKEA